MQLKQIFLRIISIFWLFLPETDIQKIYQRLTDLCPIKHKHEK